MQGIVDALMQRPFLAVSLGGFLSGVALFYLVVQRTRRRLIRQSEERSL
jgi:hypothetical protein